ncbi:hypothetical protein ABZS53_15205 [Streptomyces sp. NPDC005499]|uniref:hypothetical protein n=1 Tax=Streptomyces sp. NPDC005499 TaxID=3154883 RepID=UPI0033BABED4
MSTPPSTADAAGTRVWQQIVSIRRWVDKEERTDDSLEALTTRVLDIGEYYGETCEALLATNTVDGHELVKALCDVILAAGVALCTADREAQEAFVDSLAWDEHTGREPIGKLVIKLGQEHVAACQAVVGVTTCNPRKGAGYTMDDLVAKLCAVVRAATEALHRVDSAAETTFAATLELAYHRSLGVVRLA